MEEYQYRVTAHKMFTGEMKEKTGTIFAMNEDHAKNLAKEEANFKPEYGYYNVRAWVAILNKR